MGHLLRVLSLMSLLPVLTFAQSNPVGAVYRKPQGGLSPREMLELPSAPSARKAHLVYHKGYSVFYSSDYGVPLWVAWRLDPNRTTGAESRGKYGFLLDPALPDSLQTNPSDYARSGYDQGHMCPANDNTGSAALMLECHYALNLVPQRKVLNRSGGTWFNVEQECNKYVRTTQQTLYIVCGPIIEHSQVPSRRRLRGRSAYIPQRFFKVIMYHDGYAYRGMGLVFNQWNNMQVKTIRELEGILGFDFYKNLPPSSQNSFELSRGEGPLFEQIKRNARIE